uniref:hypothetical protein n=1 Tax=Pelagimonas sp. TaxID=2073170 RepID=UPI003D6BA01B
MKGPFDWRTKEIKDLAKLRRLEEQAKEPPRQSSPEAVDQETPLSEADRAYGIAVELIKAAQRNGDTELSFDIADTHALSEIPSEIAMLDGVTDLYFDNTSVSDL